MHQLFAEATQASQGCITYHESTHRYDSSTLGGSIGEAIAILRTAAECPSWNYATDEYIRSQASYAANSLNKYSQFNTIPQDVVNKLSSTFTEYADFKLANNNVTVNIWIKECVVTGTAPKK